MYFFGTIICHGKRLFYDHNFIILNIITKVGIMYLHNVDMMKDLVQTKETVIRHTNLPFDIMEIKPTQNVFNLEGKLMGNIIDIP
jgi:hypothetical protein